MSSMFGLSGTQLESLMYPQGRGSYYYGNTPIRMNDANEVASIGGQPVMRAQPVTGVAPPTPTGMPEGASTASSASGAMGYASVANAAIGQIANVASGYVAGKAKADAMRSQSAIPNLPESSGAVSSFRPPALSFSA